MFTNSNKKIVGIIGAMKSEIESVQGMVENSKTVTISGTDYVYGEIYGVNVVVAMCGIGKVFAAMCAQTMILTFKPDVVINVGVAGALSQGLNIGDIAIADSVVQHDMDTTPVGDPLGLISGINIINFPCSSEHVKIFEDCAKELNANYEVGVIASGDCFVNGKEMKKRITDNFNAISCEMEGGSIGHVCYMNKTAFCVVRAMSDCGDENSHNDYAESLAKASDVAFKLLDLFLKKL